MATWKTFPYKGPIVAGGYTATFHAKDILRLWPEVDYVIRREGEVAIVALMEYLEGKRTIESVPNLIYRRDGGIRYNPEASLTDVNAIPWPQREWPERGDITPIVARRGCMSRCTFCSMVPFYHTKLGPIVRRRTPSAVADEIEYCLDNDARSFMFYDDDFGLSAQFDRDWCSQFLSEIRNRKLEFHWEIEFRVADTIRGEELLREACDLGLKHISPDMESMLPRQLKLYNKGYKQEHVFKAIEIARTLPLEFQTNVIFWDPWLTIEEACEHVRLLDSIRIQDQLASANFPIFSNKLIARKGTKVHDMLAEEKRLRLRPGSFCNFEYDFVNPDTQLFFRLSSNRFAPALRPDLRPTAMWIRVPPLEWAGHKELGAAYREFGRGIANIDFEFFRKMTDAGLRTIGAPTEEIEQALDEVYAEFDPRILACLAEVPVPSRPRNGHATGP